MTDKKNTPAENYIQIEYTAYGAYSGTYDGGSVGNNLYWSKDKAREDCLKQIAEIDKDNKRFLKDSLKKFKGAELQSSSANYYREQYGPMKLIGINKWSNGIHEVNVVEFNIK